MDLPSEIRMQIMQHAFGFDIYPQLNNQHAPAPADEPTYYGKLGYGPIRNTSIWGRIVRIPDATWKKVDVPNLDILRLNKQIREDLQPYVARQTCKCFEYGRNLAGYIPNLGHEFGRFDHMQVLELDFVHREYIYFFMASMQPFRDLSMRLSGGRVRICKYWFLERTSVFLWCS